MMLREEMSCYGPPNEKAGGNLTAALALVSTVIVIPLLLWAIFG